MAGVECQALNRPHTQFVDIHFPGNEKKPSTERKKIKNWSIIQSLVHHKFSNAH